MLTLEQLSGAMEKWADEIQSRLVRAGIRPVDRRLSFYPNGECFVYFKVRSADLGKARTLLTGMTAPRGPASGMLRCQALAYSEENLHGTQHFSLAYDANTECFILTYLHPSKEEFSVPIYRDHLKHMTKFMDPMANPREILYDLVPQAYRDKARTLGIDDLESPNVAVDLRKLLTDAKRQIQEIQ